MIRMLLFTMLACTPPANAHIDFSSIKIPFLPAQSKVYFLATKYVPNKVTTLIER